MQNLTVQKVCLGLVTLAFFVAAPWLTSEILGGNTQPFVFMGGIAVLLLFVYGLGDRCWLIIPFCLPVEGNLNFLPLNFSIQELSIFAVLAYILFRMIFGLDVAWRLGPALLWVPLAGLLAVVGYHWISSGDIGIKMLGGSGWGGRRYFKVMVFALSIPLLASFPAFRRQDLQLVPLVYFLGAFVDIIPDLLTTFIPATAPLVWRFYSGVNLGEYGATLQGNFGGEQGISRVGTLSKVGMAVSLVTLAYFPPRTWLQPARLWALPTLFISLLLCALSGFRNAVFRGALTIMAGLFATLRWRALLLVPVGAAALLAVAGSQGTIFNYPLALQRALTFLPGDWDAKASSEASGSSEWRDKMKGLFFKEYFHKSPIFGTGYHFDPNLAKTDTDFYLAIAKRQAAAGDEFAAVRHFIEQKMPHEGPIHLLLVTGSVGAAFFVAFCAAMLLYAFGTVLRTPTGQVTPVQVWALAVLLPQILGFFVVFGDLTIFLAQVCPVIIILERSNRLQALAAAPQTLETSAPDHPPLALGKPLAPWQPRQGPVS
jgi:hypothetical protein